MNTIKQVQIELSKLVEVIIIGGNVLRMAMTLRVSVVCPSAVAPTGTLRAVLMGLRLAYVSNIHANPIYRRMAVTRICV